MSIDHQQAERERHTDKYVFNNKANDVVGGGGEHIHKYIAGVAGVMERLL